MMIRVGEMILGKCLLCRHENQNLDPQNPCKATLNSAYV